MLNRPGEAAVHAMGWADVKAFAGIAPVIASAAQRPERIERRHLSRGVSCSRDGVPKFVAVLGPLVL
jgi:hypothetical protein